MSKLTLGQRQLPTLRLRSELPKKLCWPNAVMLSWKPPPPQFMLTGLMCTVVVFLCVAHYRLYLPFVSYYSMKFSKGS